MVKTFEKLSVEWISVHRSKVNILRNDIVRCWSTSRNSSWTIAFSDYYK